MTLNFSDLNRRIRAGEKSTAEDIAGVLTASPAATFALVELATELRQQHFGSLIKASGMLTVPPKESVGLRVQVEAPLDVPALVMSLIDKDDTPASLELDFIQGQNPLLPMEALRVIAAARIAAPTRSLHLGPSRETSLRSLQALALGVIDSLILNDSLDEPRLIFEDLKLIATAGLTILGVGERDLVAEYVEYFKQHGVTDVAGYAQIARSGLESAGGCGGNCVCGAGGCGS